MLFQLMCAIQWADPKQRAETGTRGWREKCNGKNKYTLGVREIKVEMRSMTMQKDR